VATKNAKRGVVSGQSNSSYSVRLITGQCLIFRYSKLSLFAPDPDKDTNSRFLTMMAQPIDLSPKSVKRWWHNRKVSQEKTMQSFIPERLEILGNDLSAAHFLVHRGGAVRFAGSPNFIRRDEDGNYTLPNRYEANLFVEEIRCEGMELYFEGLENVRRLKHLKVLSIRNVQTFDDWCLDRVSGSEFDELERLDLSGTPVTFNGLVALYRLRSLRTLVLDRPRKNVETWMLTIAMLEEENPKLKVQLVEPGEAATDE
jgi:hypothetical protein